MIQAVIILIQYINCMHCSFSSIEDLVARPYEFRTPCEGVLSQAEEVHNELLQLHGIYETLQVDLAFFTYRGQFWEKEVRLGDRELVGNLEYELVKHFAIEKPSCVLLKPQEEFKPEILDSARSLAGKHVVYERLYRQRNRVLSNRDRTLKLDDLEEQMRLVRFQLEHELQSLRELCRKNGMGQSFATIKISRLRWECAFSDQTLYEKAAPRRNICGQDDSVKLDGSGYED